MKNETVEKIVEKIKNAENILIALSKNPSVDELSTAIGLSLFLDKIGKRATAIYSGVTPNALEFLNPAERLEKNTNGLQDFIIALNKNKADHLRYKIDGDYVKVFITPYKTQINQNDLEFSYGEFNVDLVIALNVGRAGDLDEALTEYGRILHDASVVSITTDMDAKFGEIVWADETMSSVGEMVARIAFLLKDKAEIDRDAATAFLTSIVAATDRFSNEKTKSETMAIAARLMASGADQQLISSNIEREVREEKATEVADAENTSNSRAESEDVLQPHVNNDEVIATQGIVKNSIDGVKSLKNVDYRSVIDQALGNNPRTDFSQEVKMSNEQENSLPEKTEYLYEAPIKNVQPVEKPEEENVVVLPMPGDDILPTPPTPPIEF